MERGERKEEGVINKRASSCSDGSPEKVQMKQRHKAAQGRDRSSSSPPDWETMYAQSNPTGG